MTTNHMEKYRPFVDGKVVPNMIVKLPLRECPSGHIDTYPVPLKELKTFWEKGWIPKGVFLMGCNVCEDFHEL